MAKSKIDAIKAKLAATKQEKDAIVAQLAQIDNKAQAAAAAAAEALQAGDFDSYKAEQKELAALKEEASFLSSYMAAKSDTISESEAKDAWKEYTAGYEKVFADKMRKVQAAQKALASAFLELVDHQNEALKTREEVATLAGLAPSNIAGVDPFPALQMSRIPNTGKNRVFPYISNPTAVYMMSAQLQPDELGTYYNSVIHLLTSSSR